MLRHLRHGSREHSCERCARRGLEKFAVLRNGSVLIVSNEMMRDSELSKFHDFPDFTVMAGKSGVCPKKLLCEHSARNPRGRYARPGVEELAVLREGSREAVLLPRADVHRMAPQSSSVRHVRLLKKAQLGCMVTGIR